MGVIFSMRNYSKSTKEVMAHFFYFHDFSFVDDCLIFTVADWSNPHREKKK